MISTIERIVGLKRGNNLIKLYREPIKKSMTFYIQKLYQSHEMFHRAKIISIDVFSLSAVNDEHTRREEMAIFLCNEE